MGLAQFSGVQLMEAVFIASLPSLILAAVFGIRLGPRVTNNETSIRDQGLEMKLAMDRYDAQLRIMENCLTRLTTLGEVAERRLERLESK
jgi:hypothetical protein